MSFESLESPEDNSVSPIIELMISDNEKGREAFEDWKDRQQEMLDRNNPRDNKEVMIYIFRCAFIYEKTGDVLRVDNCLDDALIIASQNGLEDYYVTVQNLFEDKLLEQQ